MVDVLIIGGGAAGLAAAVHLARSGQRIMILEKNPRVGKKLLATGNGRCNYTNLEAGSKDYYGENPFFIESVLSQYSPEDAIDFFRSLGIEPKKEEDGKVFPLSEQASSFLDAFLLELEELKIPILTDREVTSIEPGFTVHTKEHKYRAKALIFCPGGNSMPASGSDGKSYRMVTKLGHTLIDPFPSLVQLNLEGDFFKRIDGVKIKGLAKLLSGEEILQEERGDLLFTKYGISGPPILQLSRQAGKLLQQGQKAELLLSLYEMETSDMLSTLMERRSHFSHRDNDSFLIGLVHKRLIGAFLFILGVSFKEKAYSLSDDHLKRLAELLTAWRLPITGNQGYKTSQATAGGISTSDVDPQTLESKLVPGLFFAGEVLDVDGRCGGYNLQWAWASAYVSAKAIKEYLCYDYKT